MPPSKEPSSLANDRFCGFGFVSGRSAIGQTRALGRAAVRVSLMRSTSGRDVRYELEGEDWPAMTKMTHEQTAPSEDSVTIELNSEQTQQFLEALANPPAV